MKPGPGYWKQRRVLSKLKTLKIEIGLGVKTFLIADTLFESKLKNAFRFTNDFHFAISPNPLRAVDLHGRSNLIQQCALAESISGSTFSMFASSSNASTIRPDLKRHRAINNGPQAHMVMLGDSSPSP
jgi:hypothetical protein